jgi:hypothetical protein
MPYTDHIEYAKKVEIGGYILAKSQMEKLNNFVYVHITNEMLEEAKRSTEEYVKS